jgi:hypothetical protein
MATHYGGGPVAPQTQTTTQYIPDHPHAWLFFAVARMHDRHLPLAVVKWWENDNLSHLSGGPVPGACLRIISILSSPTNRKAIQCELSLAVRFYQDGHQAPLHELSEPERPASEHSPDPEEWRHRAHYERWDHLPAEFPFITSCVLLGSVHWPGSWKSYHARLLPLGTVYRDTSFEYGMVVVDLTDLDNVSYGIVSFASRMEVENGALSLLGVAVEEDRPRKPMSAVQFMAKFAFVADEAGVVERLEERPLVALSVLDSK